MPIEPVPLREASTVLILRDRKQGLEVLMAKRTPNTRFVAGAHVFPGGGVDEQDALAASYCQPWPETETELFQDEAAQRFYMAAARELYEEMGLWLFKGEVPDPAWRKALHAGNAQLPEMLAELNSGLDTQKLQYFRFWTTPPGNPRRYRTRFFLCRDLPEQVVDVDGIEIVDACWARPKDMLGRQQRGEVEMIFPTMMELRQLSRFSSVDEAFAAIDRLSEVPEITPDLRKVDPNLSRVFQA